MSKKYYTKEDILKKYNKLSASKQVPILWSALDYMQSYNGGIGLVDVVILAMGFTEDMGKYVKE